MSEKINKFFFGIESYDNSDSEIEFKTFAIKYGLPVEIIIMQMFAFIDKLKKDYCEDSNNNTTFINH